MMWRGILQSDGWPHAKDPFGVAPLTADVPGLGIRAEAKPRCSSQDAVRQARFPRRVDFVPDAGVGADEHHPLSAARRHSRRVALAARVARFAEVASRGTGLGSGGVIGGAVLLR